MAGISVPFQEIKFAPMNVLDRLGSLILKKMMLQ